MPGIETYPLARAVGPGSHLRVVAPAGPFDREAFDRGIEWLRQRYHVTFSAEIYSVSGYMAGSDERRTEELNAAILDPDVDAILAARGGFGCTRILPGIDRQAIANANKMIIGFSDITALHALWAGAGVRSIHAPMAASLAAAPEAVRKAWVASVENQNEREVWDLKPVNPAAGEKTAEGRFFGGNLAVLCALAGTPYAPPLQNCVLFLEDVGERPYRIDRMLTSMRHTGWLDQISALVLGSFTEGEPGPDGVSIEDGMVRQFETACFPVLGGLPAGHISENEPLGFGGSARVEGARLELIH